MQLAEKKIGSAKIENARLRSAGDRNYFVTDRQDRTPPDAKAHTSLHTQ
jgi:hypothetical protein